MAKSRPIRIDKSGKTHVSLNDGPSSPVRIYDGKVMPYYGGTRNGKTRPKKGTV